MDFKLYLLVGLFLLFFLGIFVPIIIHDRKVARNQPIPRPEVKPAEPPVQNPTDLDKGKVYDEALRTRKKAGEKPK